MKRTVRERHELLLALLEERPYPVAELMGLLACSMVTVLVTCRAQRAKGRVVELRNGRWALAGSDAARTVGVVTVKGRRSRTAFERAAARTAPLPTAAPAPAALYPGIRIIDGVEYEITFDGRGETPPWPDGGASSLGGWLHSLLQP